MKALFLSVSTGHGHNKTAYAVIDLLEKFNVECKMLDTYEYINPILSESIAKAYFISTKFTPAVYGNIYRLAEKMDNNNIKYSVNKLINSILSRKLETFLNKYNPNIIICTHIFAAQILCRIKRTDGIKVPTIGIITDFTIHPFWCETNLDYYITANNLLNNQMKKKGIPLEKVRPIGIPIEEKFMNKNTKHAARKILGYKDKWTVIIMGGSMGYGNILSIIKTVDKMEQDIQIACVCGNNTNLKNKIDNLKINKDIFTYGFVDFVDNIMDASDCIITKPGGLTVSESLAKELPMIFVNPIPGQEDRNLEFLLNNGLGIKISNTYTIDEAIYQLIYNNFRYRHIREAVQYFKKPNASQELINLIFKISGEEDQKVIS